MVCCLLCMGKRVWVTLGVIVLLLVVAGVYFYNFHVFKTVRVCLGDKVDTKVVCDVTQDCINLSVKENPGVDLSDAPDFIKENYQKIIDESISCDGTCFVRDVRGINKETQDLEDLKSCEEGEIEVKMDIGAKEGLALYNWAKGQAG